MILTIGKAIYNNAPHVAESAIAIMLVCFSHCISLNVVPGLFASIIQALQFVALVMACTASAYTIYKIKKELDNGKP